MESLQAFSIFIKRNNFPKELEDYADQITAYSDILFESEQIDTDDKLEKFVGTVPTYVLAWAEFYTLCVALNSIKDDEDCNSYSEWFTGLLSHIHYLQKSVVDLLVARYNTSVKDQLMELGCYMPELDSSGLELLGDIDEKIYFKNRGYLYKYKVVSRRKTTNYSGIRYNNGMLLPYASMNHRWGTTDSETYYNGTVSSDVLDDSGVLFIAQNTIGYLGYRKHFMFNINKIVSIRDEGNGLVSIFKENRETPYVVAAGDTNYFMNVVKNLKCGYETQVPVEISTGEYGCGEQYPEDSNRRYLIDSSSVDKVFSEKDCLYDRWQNIGCAVGKFVVIALCCAGVCALAITMAFWALISGNTRRKRWI